MTWMDYREKLGFNFNDAEKTAYFTTKCLNHFLLLTTGLDMDLDSYRIFCDITGTPISATLLSESFAYMRYDRCIEITTNHKDNCGDFLSYAIAFINSISSKKSEADFRKSLIDTLCEMLQESKIKYDLIEEEGEFFIFPKGVPELDDALVSDVLEWIHEYPQAEKAWIKALKSYADATEEKASDIADSFRKALETFFQEFFGETKALENLKPKYGAYLKNHNVPAEISSNLETLLQQYTNFMNNYAKHRDRTSDSLLEYIMYQTGNTMRLLITLKGTE